MKQEITRLEKAIAEILTKAEIDDEQNERKPIRSARRCEPKCKAMRERRFIVDAKG
jgi:hypothetical protein